MPTFHVCLTAPLLGSNATTVFCPLIAAYRVDSSGEYLIWPTRAERPFTLGIGMLVGAPSEPSALLAARNRPSGLTVEPMNLPVWVSRRSPSGLMIWLLETWIPLAYSVPT